MSSVHVHMCVFLCVYLNLTLCVCMKRVGLKRPDGGKSALHAAVHQELLAAGDTSPASAATTNPSPAAAAATANPSPAAATATTNPSPAAAAATTNSSPAAAAAADSNSDLEWSFPHEIGDRVEVYWPAEGQWFAGDIEDICDAEEQFLVHYIDDDEEYWHLFRDMEVRRCTRYTE